MTKKSKKKTNKVKKRINPFSEISVALFLAILVIAVVFHSFIFIVISLALDDASIYWWYKEYTTVKQNRAKSDPSDNK